MMEARLISKGSLSPVTHMTKVMNEAKDSLTDF